MVLVTVALLLVLPALTPPPARADVAGLDDQRAVDLLERSGRSWSEVSFSGTQYLTLGGEAGSSGAVVEVTHRAGGATRVRVVGVGAHQVPAADAGRWLASAGPVELLVDSYEVGWAGSAAVAGRPAEVVDARRSDGSLAGRFWVDRETGLTLRREVFDEDGSLRQARAFVDVRVRTGDVAAVAGASGTTGVPAGLDRDDLVALRQDGLSCPEELGQGLVLYEAREVEGAGGERAVQLSYSDGLQSVSVFEQRGRLDDARMSGYEASRVGRGTVYSRPGPPAWATWSTGGTVVTVVSDDPELLPVVVTALPPVDGSGEHGVLARLARGASRVAGWFNPFD